MLCGFHNSFHRKLFGEFIVKSKASQWYLSEQVGRKLHLGQKDILQLEIRRLESHHIRIPTPQLLD